MLIQYATARRRFEEPPAASNVVTPAGDTTGNKIEMSPAELLFSAVRASIQMLLSTSMKEAEVATALDVSTRKPEHGCNVWSLKAPWRNRRSLRAASSSKSGCSSNR
jgi:hypothetical protein